MKIILPKDKEDTALLLGGKKENFNKGYFDRFGIDLKLNTKQINAVYKKMGRWLPEAHHLIESSFLNPERKSAYQELIDKRSQLFISSN